MAQTYRADAGFRAAGGFAAMPGLSQSRADTLARLDAISRLLDSAFVLPGTNIRFGLDGIIGLVPGIGDLVTTALSSYLIVEARRLGLPRRKIARMIANVAFDAAVGIVPVFGDAVDVLFKANRRNLHIIRDHLEREERRGGGGIVDADYEIVEPRR